jgi:hypothetical protein
MEMKSCQERALELIKQIWKDKIEKAEIILDNDPSFSEYTIDHEIPDDEYPYFQGSTYHTDSYEALFLLRDCELISNLKNGRPLRISLEFEETLKHKDFPFEKLGDEDRVRLMDFLRYKELKEKFPNEIITDAYIVKVTDKCRKSTFERIEEIIINYSELIDDPVFGSFAGVELKASGTITHNKVNKGKIGFNTQQALLFRALLSQRDKDRIVSEVMIRDYFRANQKGDKKKTFNPEKDHENLNQYFKEKEIPIKVSTDDGGYILKRKNH